MSNLGKIGEIKEVRRSAQELILEWRIPKFLSLSSEDDHDFYKSLQFSFWNGCWNLRVWPDLNGSVCFGLERDNSGTLCKRVNVAFGIKGFRGVEKRRELEKKVSNDNFLCMREFLCTRSELRNPKQRLMPNNVITLTFEMRACTLDTNTSDESSETDDDLEEVHVDRKQFLQKQDKATETDDDLGEVHVGRNQSSEKQAIEELQNYLLSLLKSEEDCDVVIKVQGKEFRAHKLILRARSPVFQAMFSHDMLEKHSGVVTMEDCDPESFPALLEHMYTGSTAVISSKNVFSLFTSSDKYDLVLLRKKCSQFIKNNMTVSSFCTATALAVKHNEKELIDCVTEFFCINTLDIIKTAEWQTFLKENATVGNELFIKFVTK